MKHTSFGTKQKFTVVLYVAMYAYRSPQVIRRQVVARAFCKSDNIWCSFLLGSSTKALEQLTKKYASTNVS